MTPEQAQRIRKAQANGLRTARTPGAKIYSAIEHTKLSRKKSPGSSQGSNTSVGTENELQRNFTPPGT